MAIDLDLRIGRHACVAAAVPVRLCFYRKNGARGRSRTADTAIFSRMLYQLSYPGPTGAAGDDGSGGRRKRGS